MTKLEKNINEFVEMFNIEKLPDGRLVFYKAVMKDFGSWYLNEQRSHGRKVKNDIGAYKPGNTVFSRRCCKFETVMCGEGLHIGTLQCSLCYTNPGLFYNPASIIIKVLVYSKDIKCVPVGCFYSNHREDNKVRCNCLYVDSVVKCIE